MTKEDYLVQALGNYQLALINMRVEIEQLKDKLFKVEKLVGETKTAEVNKKPNESIS